MKNFLNFYFFNIVLIDIVFRVVFMLVFVIIENIVVEYGNNVVCKLGVFFFYIILVVIFVLFLGMVFDCYVYIVCFIKVRKIIWKYSWNVVVILWLYVVFCLLLILFSMKYIKLDWNLMDRLVYEICFFILGILF